MSVREREEVGNLSEAFLCVSQPLKLGMLFCIYFVVVHIYIVIMNNLLGLADHWSHDGAGPGPKVAVSWAHSTPGRIYLLLTFMHTSNLSTAALGREACSLLLQLRRGRGL